MHIHCLAHLAHLRAGIILLLTLCLLACEEQVVDSHWGNLRGEPNAKASAKETNTGFAALGGKSGGAPAPDDIPWAISLEVIVGPDHPARAAQRRDQLVAASGGKDIWVVDKAVRSEVYSGHYKNPDEKAAQAELARWKRLHEQGVVHSPGVLLIPTHLPGSMPDYDLARADADAIYTLEIGYYDSAYGKGFRGAAEQAAAALRQEGVEAYYYHKQDRSSVTVGAFPLKAVKTTPGSTGQARVQFTDPRIPALQQRYPTYMVNGRELRTKVHLADGTESFQPEPTHLGEIER